MSATQRTRRSRSTTAPEAGPDVAPTNGIASALNNNDRPAPSLSRSPSRLAAPPAVSAPISTSLPLKAPEVNTAMPQDVVAPKSAPAIPEPIADVDDDRMDLDDHPDNRSSSLSELGDGMDEHDEPTIQPQVAREFADNDSEAETERLENTPRKLTRTVTNLSIVSEHAFERTPSKLQYSNAVDESESRPPTPVAAVILPDVAVVDADSRLNSLALVAGSEIAELASKKRKRSSAEAELGEEPSEEPARKRSEIAKTPTINGNDDDGAHIDVDEELDRAEDHISELAEEDAELEERRAHVAAETVSELATVARLTKPKRGGRKGKRKADEFGDTNSEIAAITEAVVNGEVEDNNEDGGVNEEIAQKKAAILALSKIERKFKLFREKLCDEQIAQCERELEMLRQPTCTHPEYLSMVQCIDERRAGKIAYEQTHKRYKMKCLDIRTVAERHQMHSQYFQTVRALRESFLSECNQRIYELQRGRRQLGVEEIDYSFKFPEKRSDQIRQQAAYNQEVSILAGTARYVGFPAAPEIKPAKPNEIEDDLRAMKIITQRAPAHPYVRPSYARTTTADEAAAEEQFLERTPWANPHHPAHQQAHYHPVAAAPPRSSNQTYHTPAAQRRVVDIHAPNGSASTIDMLSNPPSSANAPGPSLENLGRPQSESPVLQMKRHPGEHRLGAETPSSHQRFAVLARETYQNAQQVGSSPAEHASHDHESQGAALGGRWNGTGTRHIPPAPSIPGRPDTGRVPLTQRSNIGTVSVGSGSSLFGR